MDWVPLPAAINPLSAVRRTTSDVMERALHVSLNGGAVEQLAKMWATDGGAGGASIGWNESGWHYSEDAAAGGTLTCQYVFVLGENVFWVVCVCFGCCVECMVGGREGGRESTTRRSFGRTFAYVRNAACNTKIFLFRTLNCLLTVSLYCVLRALCSRDARLHTQSHDEEARQSAKKLPG